MEKMPALKTELQKSIDQLSSDQSFNVIFLGEGNLKHWQVNQIGNIRQQRQGGDFLSQIETVTGLAPLPAFDVAFMGHPDLIYLVAGSFFSGGSDLIERIHQLNPNAAVKINTILFIRQTDDPGAVTGNLRTIANENGGKLKVWLLDTDGQVRCLSTNRFRSIDRAGIINGKAG